MFDSKKYLNHCRGTICFGGSMFSYEFDSTYEDVLRVIRKWHRENKEGACHPFWELAAYFEIPENVVGEYIRANQEKKLA